MTDLTEMIQDRIELINNTILNDVKADVPTLQEAMCHYPAAGGKRLRPVMALVVASAVGGKDEDALPYALALEITHNFTLIHDDLMDNDDIRRGRPSVHIKWGEATAINAGDALFAMAFKLLADVDVEHTIFLEMLKDFASMVQGIAEGQQMDMEFEERDDVTEDEYITMVEKKTALMFQYAAKGGSLITSAPRPVVNAMSEYGRLLGIGFQIWDDLLDLQADEKTLGKPVGSDIKNGKRTIAAIWAVNNLEGENRKKFLHAYGNMEAAKEDIDQAVEAMVDGGAIPYAHKLAMEYADRSRKLLDCLEPSKDKEILEATVDYMINRSV